MPQVAQPACGYGHGRLDRGQAAQQQIVQAAESKAANHAWAGDHWHYEVLGLNLWCTQPVA